MSTVGVVGLGRMGGRMSERLLDDGFDVVGFDVREGPLERLEARLGERASSPGDVASRASVVVTSLPSVETVEDAFCDDDGLVAGNEGALTVLETSTSRPETTMALADVASDEGIRVVDCPVSGGPEGARSGTLTLMLGTAASDLGSDADAVLSSLGADRYYLGAVGAGHTAKLVNNLMTNGNRVLAMEAMALGAARDVDLATLFDLVSNSSGSSNQFEKRMPRVLNRNFAEGYMVDLARKDVKLALEMAHDVDYPMAISSLVHETLVEASAKGYGDEDPSIVVKLFEESTGVPVETPTEMDETFEGY